MSETMRQIVVFGGYLVIAVVVALVIGVSDVREAARKNKDPDLSDMPLGIIWPGLLIVGACMALAWTAKKLARTHTLPEVRERERRTLARRIERTEHNLGVGRDE